MVHKIDLFDPRFVSPLDVLVKNFFDQDAVFNKPDNRSVKHPVDVFEDDNGLTFEVACTGLDKSDVDITIEGDILKIAYERGDDERKSDNTPGKEQKRYYHNGIKRSSFNFGWKVARRFELAKANAEMDNGLLSITVPYANESKPKSLKIK
jgi:HSP20 family molecular chaperone IbpA